MAGADRGAPAKRLVSPLASVVGLAPTAERSGRAAGPGVGAAEPFVPAAATLHGPYVAQVDMAIAMGGTLLCTGPTGNGKTSLFLENAIRYGWGVELVVLHYGKRVTCCREPMSEATALATIVLQLVPLHASPTGSWAASALCSCSTNLPARTKAPFPL